MPHDPSRLEPKIIVLLSGVHPKGRFQLSVKVSFREDAPRVPVIPVERTLMTLRFADSTNASRFPSADIEVQSNAKPAQLVIRLGFAVGFPVRVSTRTSQ